MSYYVLNYNSKAMDHGDSLIRLSRENIANFIGESVYANGQNDEVTVVGIVTTNAKVMIWGSGLEDAALPA